MHFGVYISMYTLLYFTLILWYNIHTDLTRRTQCGNLQSDIKMRPALFLVAVLADVVESAKRDAPIYEGDKENQWVRLSDVENALNKYLNI